MRRQDGGARPRQSDEAFAQHRANIVNTAWAGDAKDAALNRVTTDAVVVASQTAVQRAGAQIAEDGSRDIQAAKREALGAIAAAEADGFEVGEDLSVTDTREVDETEIAARTMAAREHAEDIRWFAERLSQTDEFVGKRLQDKAVELEGIRFDGERDDRSDSSVQLVDNKTGTDTEANPEGTKEEQSGDRTWQDMLLPPEEPDGPDAERSEGGPDAAAGEDAEPADDGPPNPLDALAGEGSSADPDTPANVDEALFGPGAATPPSVLDRLAAQARGERLPPTRPTCGPRWKARSLRRTRRSWINSWRGWRPPSKRWPPPRPIWMPPPHRQSYRARRWSRSRRHRAVDTGAV